MLEEALRLRRYLGVQIVDGELRIGQAPPLVPDCVRDGIVVALLQQAQTEQCVSVWA